MSEPAHSEKNVLGGPLLACSYAIGTVNRWRERGPLAALVAPSGFAGIAVFLGGALALAGVLRSLDWLIVGGATLIGAGVLLLALGFLLEAGRGPAGIAQAVVEVVDAVVRVAANAISFARLAAFGLMHGALTAIVWDGTSSAPHHRGRLSRKSGMAVAHSRTARARHGAGAACRTRVAVARKAGMARMRPIAASSRTSIGANGRVTSEMRPKIASPVHSAGLR